MKKNKNFAIVLLVVVGLLIIGGITYSKNYTKNKEDHEITKSVLDNQVDNDKQDDKSSQKQIACNSMSTPYIKVTSPNGGEMYHAGQTINITWKSCNLPSTDLVNINLIRPSNVHVVTTPDASNQFPIANGSAQITVTATGVYPATVQYGNVYKILLNVIKPSSNDTGKLDAQDWSDNSFTIKQ